jgi:hypothetical protein
MLYGSASKLENAFTSPGYDRPAGSGTMAVDPLALFACQLFPWPVLEPPLDDSVECSRAS